MKGRYHSERKEWYEDSIMNQGEDTQDSDNMLWYHITSKSKGMRKIISSLRSKEENGAI